MVLLDAIKESLHDKIKRGLDWSDTDKQSVQSSDSLKTLHDLYATCKEQKAFGDNYNFILLNIAHNLAKNVNNISYLKENILAGVDIPLLATEVLLKDNCIQDLTAEEITSIINCQWYKAIIDETSAEENNVADENVKTEYDNIDFSEKKTRVAFYLISKIFQGNTSLVNENLLKLQHAIAVQPEIIKDLYGFGYALHHGWKFVSSQDFSDAVVAYQHDFFLLDLCKLFNQTITIGSGLLFILFIT